MDREEIIKVNNLTRIYKVKKTRMEIKAINKITFSVYRGEIFGLLGPNGAGKTTTIKILSTLLAPTQGTAEIFGEKCFGEEKKIRGKINFIFGGERGLYWRLSAYENLMYFGDLYKIPHKQLKKRIEELLVEVDLKGREKEKVENFSKGMKQRLQIIRGLINDPEVLFLDEPTLGLDPVGAQDLRKIILKLKENNKTILLTTHDMREADFLCDRIAIIDKGEIIANGTPKELKLKYLGDENCSLEEVYLHLIKKSPKRTEF